MTMFRGSFVALLCVTTVLACGSPAADSADASSSAAAIHLTPVVETERVAHDPDDPAIWVSAADPSRSLILATDKQEGTGALYVFGLDGHVKQTIAPLDRPNNVDIEYGFRMGDREVDIAVLTERMQHRLRIFAIPPDGSALTDLAPEGLPVLDGQSGEASEPMGIALYKRPADGAIFAVVSPKTGGPTEYLWQYRLEADGDRVRATFVRRFGAFSGVGPAPDEAGEIEAIVVDDELGYVYYSDEQAGVRKWRVDPDAPDARGELAMFGPDQYLGDREGLAIYQQADGRGFLVSSDQIEDGSRLHLYRREGDGDAPNSHPTVAVIPTSADETDGLEVTSQSLPGFPNGLLVMMNSGSLNFQLYRWDDVVEALTAQDR